MRVYGERLRSFQERGSGGNWDSPLLPGGSPADLCWGAGPGWASEAWRGQRQRAQKGHEQNQVEREPEVLVDVVSVCWPLLCVRWAPAAMRGTIVALGTCLVEEVGIWLERGSCGCRGGVVVGKEPLR